MLWLSNNQKIHPKKLYKLKKYKCNLYVKNITINLNFRKTSLSKFTFYLYIPHIWNFIILNTLNMSEYFKVIYLYSSMYYFKILINSYKLFFFYDTQVRVFYFKNIYKYNLYSLFLKKLFNIYYSFAKLVFLKLKFKGKGYYIYKNVRNTITPQFGYAHRIYIYSYFISVKFLSKTKVFLFGLSKNDIIKVGYNIKISKPINIFTGRGVRFAKQIIYKKTGKVSSYK